MAGRATWRSAALLWAVPIAFGLMALGMGWDTLQKQIRTVPGEGTVVRVYEYADSAPWRRGQPVYAPVFAYTWSDGALTEASAGMSHKDWNFALGSTHAIRYFPDWKQDVVLPGAHNWAAPGAVMGLALVMALPAWVVHRRLRRADYKG